MIERGRDARYVATGHLLYVVSGTLLAVPFDEERLEVTGAPVPMVEGLETTSLIGNSGAAQYSVSETGSLVYVSRSAQKARRLVWVYDISPDGERFLMIKEESEGSSSPEIHVVLNWFEELKRLVPSQ